MPAGRPPIGDRLTFRADPLIHAQVAAQQARWGLPGESGRAETLRRITADFFDCQGATVVTTEYATKTLTTEGYAPADITATLDSLIAAGLEIDDQPNDGWVVTTDEIDQARRQLGAEYTTEGRIRIHGRHIGFFDADGGEWVGPVDKILAEHGYRRTADWTGDFAPIEAI